MLGCIMAKAFRRKLRLLSLASFRRLLFMYSENLAINWHV